MTSVPGARPRTRDQLDSAGVSPRWTASTLDDVVSPAAASRTVSIVMAQAREPALSFCSCAVTGSADATRHTINVSETGDFINVSESAAFIARLLAL